MAPLSPSGRGSVTPQNFSRNVPERSTFHAGTTNRTSRARAGMYGIQNSSQDTSSLNPGGVRPSNFFSKISSKFSKRYPPPAPQKKYSQCQVLKEENGYAFSVTRFGEISPIWQNLKVLRQFFGWLI